ncbi:MAG: MFS transporter, partial [Variibacter sp.]
MSQPSFASIETRQSWTVAFVALGVMAFAYGAPWINVVALKGIAAEAGGERAAPALAGALAWFGAGFGGIAMGYIAERIGVRWTVMFGAVMIACGLTLSSFGPGWPLYVGHGLFIGLFGLAGINAPLFVYVSRWFDRRRGSALALISSGSYIAGAVWPPIFERVVDIFGWRQAMLGYGLVEALVILPFAASFLVRPPDFSEPVAAASVAPTGPASVLGWPPNLVFALLMTMIFACCVPMAMPQQHLVAFCSDLGINASRGALMLSVLLGTAFLCRQIWGLIADRIGGLRTV